MVEVQVDCGSEMVGCSDGVWDNLRFSLTKAFSAHTLQGNFEAFGRLGKTCVKVTGYSRTQGTLNTSFNGREKTGGG